MRKGEKMPEEQRKSMLGNTRGHANKGRRFKTETIVKMSLAKLGKTSSFKGKKHSLKTREKISQKTRAFYKRKNPDYIPFEYDDRKKIRRERIKIYGGFHSNGEWETLKTQYNFTCPSCHKQEPSIKLTRDHIIPISKGGSDNIENIQPLCSKCNTIKSTNSIKY